MDKLNKLELELIQSLSNLVVAQAEQLEFLNAKVHGLKLIIEEQERQLEKAKEDVPCQINK